MSEYNELLGLINKFVHNYQTGKKNSYHDASRALELRKKLGISAPVETIEHFRYEE